LLDNCSPLCLGVNYLYSREPSPKKNYLYFVEFCYIDLYYLFVQKIVLAILLFFISFFPAITAKALPSGGIGIDNPEISKKAYIKDGLAYPREGTPARIKKALRAGNRIAKKPYLWGGGHALWQGGMKQYIKKSRGFDCSGSVSFLLGRFGAGFIKRPYTSGGFLSWGRRGKGEWLTVYTSAGHAYLVIAGLRFDTSGLRQRGTRWSKNSKVSPRLQARTIR
jgi:hypothetical protein